MSRLYDKITDDDIATMLKDIHELCNVVDAVELRGELTIDEVHQLKNVAQRRLDRESRWLSLEN